MYNPKFLIGMCDEWRWAIVFGGMGWLFSCDTHHPTQSEGKIWWDTKEINERNEFDDMCAIR